MEKKTVTKELEKITLEINFSLADIRRQIEILRGNLIKIETAVTTVSSNLDETTFFPFYFSGREVFELVSLIAKIDTRIKMRQTLRALPQ